MSDHVGLPQPFHDEHGFPLCIVRIRDEVNRRGGAIVGEGLTWRVIHPDPHLPDIEVDFDEDGELLIKSGQTWAEFHCTEKWWQARDLWLYEKHRRYAKSDERTSSWRQKLVKATIGRVTEPMVRKHDRDEYLATDPPSTVEDCIYRFLNGEVTEGSGLEGREVKESYPAWPPT